MTSIHRQHQWSRLVGANDRTLMRSGIVAVELEILHDTRTKYRIQGGCAIMYKTVIVDGKTYQVTRLPATHTIEVAIINPTDPSQRRPLTTIVTNADLRRKVMAAAGITGGHGEDGV